MTFDGLWDALLPVGRDLRTGGYRRGAWTPAELSCREWFVAAAQGRGMDLRPDRNGNLWAWWGAPGPGALVLGSHLDSVPDGGAFDGALGVVSAFAALDTLRGQGFRPGRPLAVVAFADGTGARFGVGCAGSRLFTGALDPDRARALTDADGVTMAEAMSGAGHDPGRLGRDDETLGHIGSYVELHVDQGRQLADLGAPVGVAAGGWPHGCYRLTFAGVADHAGTTRLADRRDPMLTYAETVLAARKRARLAGARVTFGRVQVEPDSAGTVPSVVRAWLDARAAGPDELALLVGGIARSAAERAGRDGTTVDLVAEWESPEVAFEPGLRDRVAAAAAGAVGVPVPSLTAQAGHDAGVLAAEVPAALLLVRNPTGVSHAPAEHADRADCLAGVAALAAVVRAEATQATQAAAAAAGSPA